MILAPKRNNRTHIFLNQDRFSVVTCLEYLGHMIMHDLRDDKDVQKRLNEFYSSFNSILRNFKGLTNNSFLFLFNSYCKPDYGLSLLNHKDTPKSCMFRAFEVAYSKAMKQILNVPVYSSNHEVAEKCNLMLLKHHLALTQCRYYTRLTHSANPIIKHNLPVLKEGHFFKKLTE